MSGLGLYAAHAVLMGVIAALCEYLLCQVRNIEDVDILVAVCLPELCGLNENVFLRMDIQKCRRRQKILVFLKTFNVKVNGIAFAKLVDSFDSCHCLTPSEGLLIKNENC